MDQNMTEQKALWHALMTVGMAALLVAGFVLYLVGPHSADWPIFAAVIVIPALLLFPMVYIRYKRGPSPPLTRRQHLKRAGISGFLACIYVLGTFMEPHSGWKLFWKWCYVGVWLLMAIDHLRRAYRKEGNPSLTQ